ncbi:MAG: DUF2721 domain-containing protein [Chlorobiaceae bacterium]|nr:DUF2721 domain-containing protein [Chlorobiaceae bacterium]
MPESPVTAIQAIQAILAPALGISAVGLLLLSLGNRYSTIINRIRLLNDEKRRFSRQIAEKGDLGYPDNIRFMSISKQTEELLYRSKFVRNAILSLQLAIGLFVLSSVTIALNLFTATEFLKIAPLIIFIIGMCCVLVAVVFYGMDVYRSYKIILLEVRGEE